MAVNRLSLVCKACDERLRPADGGMWPKPRPSVAVARLPIGGDWTGPRTEQFHQRYLEDPDAAVKEFRVATHRPPEDGGPMFLGESIAAFINRHRWHHDTGAGLDHLVFEWECDSPCTSGGSGPEDEPE